MKNFVNDDILFTEMPQANGDVKVQITEFDRNHTPHSSFMYVTRHRWEQACEGDTWDQEVIKGAYKLIRDNGYIDLLK